MLRLIHGDNLEAIRGLEPESVTLGYLDPPFMTGRDFYHADGRLAYSDRWKTLDHYLVELEERLEAIRPKLARWGSVVVHVDPKIAAYVRMQGDAVFGRHGFASEIVWRYRRWPAKCSNFQRVHDVLLRWVVDAKAARWTQLYEPLAPSTVKTHGTNSQHHAWVGGSRKKTNWGMTGNESPGVAMGDVWDIGIVAPVSKERTGYPTQKPEALLERLLLATTAPGDLVLDPYCGSATTLAVAQRLGRDAIGIDASVVAIDVAKARLGMEA